MDRPAPGAPGGTSQEPFRAASLDAPPPAPRLRPNGPIVPAAEIAVWGEAREALSAAYRHAARTRRWAQEALDEERRRGHAEGRAAGAQEAVRLVAETTARATAHLDALERDLPALVHGIVAQILGDLDAGEIVARSVHQAVAELRPGSEASLRVGPGDADRVAQALSSLDGGAAIRIEVDPTLGPGEACLRSALGSVELGVAAQLRALASGLGVAAAGTSSESPGAGREAA